MHIHASYMHHTNDTHGYVHIDLSGTLSQGLYKSMGLCIRMYVFVFIHIHTHTYIYVQYILIHTYTYTYM
jgi:hypothetical protein